jgi:uncharacterized peroxidase-related enzyme
MREGIKFTGTGTLREMKEIAWIHTASEEEASQTLKQVYNQASKVYGADLNLVRSVSLWPELVDLQAKQLELFSEGASDIGPEIRDLIGARVAQLHNCAYGQKRYHAALNARGWSDEKITHILQDIESTHLNDRDRAILRFADKMTRRSQSMSADDIEMLRHSGLSDKAILETAAVTAYFNSQTLLANALGVMRGSA